MSADEFDEIFEPKTEEPEQVSENPQEIVNKAKHRAEELEQQEPLLPETLIPQSHWSPKDKVVELPTEVEKPPGPTLPGAREITMPTAMELQQPEFGTKGPWIQYNGVATVRILTRNDWAAAGVASDKYCEWNYLNNKRLPRSMFNDQELQYLLRVDGRFSLETK